MRFVFNPVFAVVVGYHWLGFDLCLISVLYMYSDVRKALLDQSLGCIDAVRLCLETCDNSSKKCSPEVATN